MNVKCTKCKQDKSTNEFNKRSKSKTGYDCTCKECVKKTAKNYYKNNKHVIKEYQDKHKDNIKEYNDHYMSDYYLKNQDKLLTRQRKYHEVNKDILNQKQKPRSRKHYLNNKKQHIQYQNEYIRNRMKTDLNFRLRILLGNRMTSALWKYKAKKIESSVKILGCPLKECVEYLEKQFKPEMNWANHGVIWEIDHIIACANFDLTDPEQQKKCFHYTNLQPLFKTTEIAEGLGHNEIGNRNKSNK